MSIVTVSKLRSWRGSGILPMRICDRQPGYSLHEQSRCSPSSAAAAYVERTGKRGPSFILCSVRL